jgi:ABC-type lipoprotein export system ATPase subunit
MSKKILRPNFTKNIHQHYIKKGKSLNIFGARGVGKSRFMMSMTIFWREFCEDSEREVMESYAQRAI